MIPIAWFILFTLMGIARYRILKDYNNEGQSYLIIGLAFLCATYAYYTLGLSRLTGISPLWFGLCGNIFVALVAAAISWVLYNRATNVSYLIVPTVKWILFATCIVVGQMKQKGLF